MAELRVWSLLLSSKNFFIMMDELPFSFSSPVQKSSISTSIIFRFHCQAILDHSITTHILPSFYDKMQFLTIASILSLATAAIASPAVDTLQGRQSGGTGASQSECKNAGGQLFCCNTAASDNPQNQALLPNILGGGVLSPEAQGCK